MNCDCEACEVNVFEIDNIIKYTDVELGDLAFKTFNLIIMFFIIFIIYASIILLKIK